MTKNLPSTGETQAISAVPEHHHGFVDNCIALIQNLLDQRSLDLPEVHPQPEEAPDR